MNTSVPDLNRPEWVPDAVFYQVFPDRFAKAGPMSDDHRFQPWGSPPDRDHRQGGNLAGLLSGLNHLGRLGVNALWLSPIFAAGSNHRYDTHDYLTIDPDLGDEGLFKEVVTEAHNLGIKVVLDGVFNHCGSGFWAFQDLVTNGEHSRYRDWFDVHDFPLRTDPPNYQTCGGAPYLPKLNTNNPDLRNHLLEVATYWIDAFDIDGWRLDVPWKVPHNFWAEFRTTVHQIKPDAYLVGELWRDATPWLDVFDGAMNYRMRDVILDFCIHDDQDAEDAALELDILIAGHGPATPWMLNLVGSHDTARIRTLADGDPDRTWLAHTALFTLPGAPCIYYGDELGMQGGNDPGCRGAMPANPDQWWNPHTEALARLVATRHAHPALRRGDFTPLMTFNGLLAYRRTHADDDVVVVLNVRNPEPDVTIAVPGATGIWIDQLTNQPYHATGETLHLGDIPEATPLILSPIASGGQRDR